MVGKLLLLFKFLVVSGFHTSFSNEKYGKALVGFESFLSNFNKSYENPAEKMKRFGIFVENLQSINEMNKNDPHATYAVNEFTDLSAEEFHNFYTGALPDLGYAGCTDVTSPRGRNAPEELDWRSKGIVTPIKNQLSCGACWAYATTGVVESRYAAKYGQTVDLSEQEILDCTDPDEGCKGGDPSSAFGKLINMGGQVSEADYPYEDVKGACRFDANKIVARVSACKSYNMNEEDLKQVVYEDGPITVKIDSTNLNSYHDGVFGSLCTTSKDKLHAVVIVGYGKENGVPYWLIKNSWGPNWANAQGYFKLNRGTNACLVGTQYYQASCDIA